MINIDNPTHFNSKKEKKRAQQNLELAKKNSKKVVFVKKGFSYDFEKYKQKLKNK